MLQRGFFELRGTADEILPRLAGKTLKWHGVVYFANFSDGAIKVDMTRGAKSRIHSFWKTAASYERGLPIRFGVSPILANHEEIEKRLHKALSSYWVERELFSTTEATVELAASRVQMDVLRSCMWPACKGYFNYDGKASVRPGLAGTAHDA